MRCCLEPEHAAQTDPFDHHMERQLPLIWAVPAFSGRLRLFRGLGLRILIADDQADVREGIRSLLERHPRFEVCAEAADGEEAVEKTLQYNPDLVILDVSMPVMNGMDAAKMIRQCSPQTPILMVSVHSIRELIEEARKIGVQGYVAKAQVGEILVEAIDAILQHQRFFPADPQRPPN
jgi:DNA-binding NarL/FixJ family response regulator